MGILLGVCSLPLVCLVFYFLSTGINREITTAEGEREGLTQVSQAVTALQGAVELSWKEGEDDPEKIADVDAAIAALNEAEGRFRISETPAAPAVSAGSHSQEELKASWEKVKGSGPRSAERFKALRELAERLHEGIFKASNDSGLSAGPDNEISALTDVVSVFLPLHVERLLHMHETMVPDLEHHGWDANTIAAAGIFARQVEEEDAKRLARSINAAIEADAFANFTVAFAAGFP